MRASNQSAQKLVKSYLISRTNSQRLVVDDIMKNQIGNILKNDLQLSILKMRYPPNAMATVFSKGSTNPLIDTGFMRMSVTWKEIL